MPELVSPHPRFRASFLRALEEFRAEGQVRAGSMLGEWEQRFGPQWREDAGFVAFVDYLRADAVWGSTRPRGRVPQSTYWWVDDAEYLGRISVRHRLNRFLAEVGGHIGYEVRPMRRREGHATAMLRAVLPHARDLHIDPALVTCDDDNVASRKVIEAAGGALQDQRGDKLRYWVPTGLSARA